MDTRAVIDTTLQSIRKRFYHDKPIRRWKQDEPMLIKSLCRLGKACDDRGWAFNEEQASRILAKVVGSIQVEPAYLPAYLESAVDGWVKSHADELRDQFNGSLDRTMKGLTFSTDVMAAHYKELSKLHAAKREHRKAVAADSKRQGVLL